MRIAVLGECAAAREVRLRLRYAGFLVREDRGDFEVRVCEAQVPQPLVEGLECELVQHVERRLMADGPSARVLRQMGGLRSDRAVAITIPAMDAERRAVSLAVEESFLAMLAARQPSAWRSWRDAAMVLIVCLLCLLAGVVAFASEPLPSRDIVSAEVGMQLTIPPVYQTVQDEGLALPQRSRLNCVGEGIACSDDAGNDATVITVSGGGSGGHTIQDEGSDLTARANLNCVGAGITCADDAGNDATTITVPSWAPTDAQYWVGAANGSLSAEKDLSGFTALVLNTAGTPSAYTGIDCTNQFVRDVSGTGAGTCASVNLSADVTGTLPIASGGTGQTTQTAAFDALDPLTAEGDLLAHDGTNSIRFPLGVIGQFLRVNTNVAGSLEWATGPNVADQDADVSSTSNTVTSMLLNMAATPAADTWFAVDCMIVYETAATTTGITVSLFANNLSATAAPQYFTAKFTIGGFGAAGTDSDYVSHISTPGTLVTTTGVQAANTPYVLKIDALMLTHASAADAFVTPLFRSEVSGSAVTIKEGSYCKGYVLHVDA